MELRKTPLRCQILHSYLLSPFFTLLNLLICKLNDSSSARKKTELVKIWTLPRRGQGSTAVVNGRSKMTQGGSSWVKYCKYTPWPHQTPYKGARKQALANWGCWVWKTGSVTQKRSGLLQWLTITPEVGIVFFFFLILFQPGALKWP